MTQAPDNEAGRSRQGPDPIALKQLRAEAERLRAMAVLEALKQGAEAEEVVVELLMSKANDEVMKQIGAYELRPARPESWNHARTVREAQRVTDAVQAFDNAQEALTRARGEAQKVVATLDNNFKSNGVSVIHGDPPIALAQDDVDIAISRRGLAELELQKAVDGLRLFESGDAQPPASVAKSTKSIAVRTTANIAGPYRSSPQLPDRGTHPLMQRLLEQYPTALSTGAEGRVSAFVHQLSDLDTHPPVLEGLAKLAIVVEQDSFPPSELLQLLGELHDVWRPDGIHADSTEAVLTLLNRTKKQIDTSYTLGFKAFPIIPVVLIILYVTGVPPLIFGGVLSMLSIAVAMGAQVLQLINHRRKDLDEMRADLKKLLPPLKREKLPPASNHQLPQETSSND